MGIFKDAIPLDAGSAAGLKAASQSPAAGAAGPGATRIEHPRPEYHSAGRIAARRPLQHFVAQLGENLGNFVQHIVAVRAREVMHIGVVPALDGFLGRGRFSRPSIG